MKTPGTCLTPSKTEANIQLCWVFWYVKARAEIEADCDSTRLTPFPIAFQTVTIENSATIQPYLNQDNTVLVFECVGIDSQLFEILRGSLTGRFNQKLILDNRLGFQPDELDSLASLGMSAVYGGSVDRISLQMGLSNALHQVKDKVAQRERAAELSRYVARLEKLSTETALLRDLGRAALNEAAIVAFTDSQGHVTRVNQNYVEISGRDRDEMVGLIDAIPLPISPDDETVQDLWRQILGRKTWKGELRRFRKDGSMYWVYCVISPVLDEFDEVEGYVTIAFDISAKKEAEESFLIAKVAAERAAEARKIFLANMSHEIRTPLNAILGLGNLLADTHLDGEQSQMLNLIRSSGQHMLELISHILDFSKIDTGRVEVNKQSFSLEKTLDRVSDLIRSLARDKEIEFRCIHDPQLPLWVLGDEKLIKQILINLLSNSIKFTDRGFVQLSTRFVQDNERSGRVHFTVQDSGIGIDSEKLKELFQPFVQAHSRVGIEYGGSGLGLALSKQLAELMGGHIEVSSDPEQGSQFVLTLPFDLAHARAPTQGDAHPVLSISDLQSFMREKHILVVDDIDVNRMVMRGVLRKLGAKSIAFAVDGEDALQHCRESSFDLIFMDMRMPVMDGLEATREIRHLQEAHGGTQYSLILALTANASQDDLMECRSAGMNGFLPKPLAEKDLQVVLHELADLNHLNPFHPSERFYTPMERD